jgi:hypothetical protein
LRASFTLEELGGIAAVVTSFSITWVNFLIGNPPLTYIYLR